MRKKTAIKELVYLRKKKEKHDGTGFLLHSRDEELTSVVMQSSTRVCVCVFVRVCEILCVCVCV